MSLKNNLVKNGIATGIQKVMRMLEQLLLVPFFISAWGAAYYGEWLTLTIVPSMMAFADMGLGSAASNTFVLRYAAGDLRGAGVASRSGFVLLSATVLGSLIVGGAVLGGLYGFDVFQKSLIPVDQALLAIAFLMTARVLDFYQQLYEGYYRAARKAALSIYLITGYSALKLSVSLLLLKNSKSIVELALGELTVSLIFNLFFGLIARKVLPLLGSEGYKVNKKDMMDIAKKGAGYLMGPIWQAIFFQGTTMSVRIILGAEAVAIFNTLRTVSRSVNQGFSLINGTIFPEIQYEIGAGRFDKARKVFRIAVGISGIGSLAGVIGLAFFGPWLYEKWTHNELHPPDGMWYVFLIGIILNSLWWTAGVVFRAMNKPRGLAVMGLIGAVISVGLSFLLSKYYGLTGAAIGSIALEIIMAAYVLPVTCRMLNEPFRGLPRAIIADFVSIYKNFRKADKAVRSIK